VTIFFQQRRLDGIEFRLYRCI